MRDRIMWLVCLLWLITALVGAAVADKTATIISPPQTVEAGAYYTAKVFHAIEMGGTAIADFDVLWYDGTGDGTETETPLDTTNVFTGKALLEADVAESPDRYLMSSLPLQTPEGAKYARVQYTPTWDEAYKLYASPQPLERAKDRRDIVPANITASHLDLGVPGALYNGDMEIPNLDGTLPDGWDATGTYEYGVPSTGNYNGSKAVTMGSGVPGVHTLLSPRFLWPKYSTASTLGFSLGVYFQSTLNEAGAEPAIAVLRSYDITDTQVGTDVQLTSSATGLAFEIPEGDDATQSYVPSSSVDSDAVYGRIVWLYDNTDTSNLLVIDGLRLSFQNDVLYTRLLVLTDNDGKAINSLNSGSLSTKYAANIGNGVATSIVVTHNLGTRDVLVAVYDNASPYAEVSPTIQHTSTNTVTLIFGVAPTSNQYRVVIRN